MRGSSITLFALACFLVIVATLLYVVLRLAWASYAPEKFGAAELLVAILPVVLVASAASTMTWRRTLRRVLFTYTHYPVRFERERGFVHVFRHNGPDGVLSVPWKDVHWFVGRGERREYLLDVRGEGALRPRPGSARARLATISMTGRRKASRHCGSSFAHAWPAAPLRWRLPVCRR